LGWVVSHITKGPGWTCFIPAVTVHYGRVFGGDRSINTAAFNREELQVSLVGEGEFYFPLFQKYFFDSLHVDMSFRLKIIYVRYEVVAFPAASWEEEVPQEYSWDGPGGEFGEKLPFRFNWPEMAQ
jgi:hypothetical protein